MMCEACERGDHGNCGMQTWCECDCDGTWDDEWDLPEECRINDRTMTCGHTPEDCDCEPTPEQEDQAARDEAYWDGSDIEDD